MIRNIAFTSLFGLPLVVYGGFATLFLVIFTATVGYLNSKGNHLIPFKWHPILALTTIVVAVIHGLLGLSMFLGF